MAVNDQIRKDKRFSISAYSEQFNRRLQHDSGIGSGPSGFAIRELLIDDFSGETFLRMVEEARAFLTAFQGKTEEERSRHNELLNKAVLGFSEERRIVFALLDDWVAKRRWQHVLPPNQRYRTISEAVFAEVIGLGVLELVLANREGLEEIQVIGKQIFEVRKGQPELSVHQFQKVKDVEQIQQNLVLFNQDTLNPRKKWAEVRMNDGSRVTLTGFGYTSEPTLTIRFFVVKHYSLLELCHPDLATISEPIQRLLQVLIKAAFNFIIIGSTNSGKTHLMKAMISEIADDERIITIESRHELMLRRDFPHKNIVEYECPEEDGQHTGRQAFKLALRQSPKRICLAEIRDEEANLYVRACTRGHEGSMTTVHVNELEDAPEAITDMCMLDGRGMDPSRLMKRITQYVTQIGIEMAIIRGQRRIVRLGEFYYDNGEAFVRDWVRLDHTTNQWIYFNKMSTAALARIQRMDKLGYQQLLDLGWKFEGVS